MEENGLDADGRELGVLDHLKNTDTWLRLAYMLLFGIVFQIVKLVVFVVATVQFLFKALTGDVHARIQVFGAGLAAYLRETTEFLTFVSDRKPYPWAEWPSEREKAPESEKAPPAKASVSKGTRSRKKASGPRKSKKTVEEKSA